MSGSGHKDPQVRVQEHAKVNAGYDSAAERVHAHTQIRMHEHVKG